MNSTEQAYVEKLEAYRMALGLWSETRAHYAPEAPEVIAAAGHLEALEQELSSFKQPAVAA
jgi:hypothetical protein